MKQVYLIFLLLYLFSDFLVLSIQRYQTPPAQKRITGFCVVKKFVLGSSVNDIEFVAGRNTMKVNFKTIEETPKEKYKL